ncbi:thioesterase [Steroidobacter agaridevorans]|uniref:Thioesterase n=1 Tax=Steroidobacter agaridevorans TaxID=2695856 RepID=A0A829Y543_9GAMM|nr:hotdog fold thioesterase [Steroidobacter agaridevorans]GFE78141.1 thioesterase [Steroidobacter agaridevorans]GFE91200.1 thioesterase [Steroidobacter agaridevorans]
MSIWFKPYKLADLTAHIGMAKHLGIEFTELGPDFLRGRMPVEDRTHQPHGILHGGASVALAETLGSYAAMLTTDPDKYRCLGQEINANHIRGVSSGFVIGTARPIHLGRRSHVWDIRIVDERDKLVCISRLTMAVIEIEPKN